MTGLPAITVTLLRLARFGTLLLVAGTAPAQVFINEIHYDNSSTDTGEAIEIAGAAGTDLTGWSLVLYNGATGGTYDTDALSGVIADQQGGFGTVAVNHPTNGLQNGSPDGIALVDAGANVVQFLSYEGSFTAIGGPADGLDSVDIGVEETSGTATGESLQLTGSGSFYNNFTWAGPATATFGAVNTGQTFGGGEPPAPELVINEVDYDQPGTDTAEFIELRNNGAVSVDLGAYLVDLVNGSNGSAYASIALPDTSLAAGDDFVSCAQAANTPNCDLDVSPDNNLVQNGSPDAVALVLAGTVVDAVSYEGDTAAPYTEGSGAGIADESGTGFIGLSRFPDGTDTDQNSADFSLRCITPGLANNSDNTNCPDPLAGPPVVINEFLADPATDLAGDANNDGTRDASDDEFIEIVNVSGGELDLSGWTLADSTGNRHTFPAGSVVADQCAIVVFGGASPLGSFGGATVETASGGFLGLNNGGDSLTLTDGALLTVSLGYGSEGGSDESLTLNPDVTGVPPYVQHSAAAGAAGALFSPGTRVDGSLFDGCEEPMTGPLEIHEIQGSGAASPYVGREVTTRDNIVTAVGPEGFFMQTPDDPGRSDGNVDTSDGIYVFTGGAPAVQPGDLVDVTGLIAEFFDFTEFSGNPTVAVTNAGLPLPAPVVFDENAPSPDPAAPSCAIEYECYEGMLIRIENGTVTGPNQGFGSDPIAEVHVTAAVVRAFREPGIEFPGLAGLPVWDGNPEVFELDPDKLGLPNRTIAAGSSFSASGALGFEFGGYELWATRLEVTEAPLPQPARRAERHELAVGSLNLFRLFDDVDDPPGSNAFSEPTNDTFVPTDEYQRRLTKFADYIVNSLRSPDILAVQEVEKLGVLQDLAGAIDALDKHGKYEAYLEEGNDIGGIDVGFLVKKKVKVQGVTQFGFDETYVEPNGDLDLLHDRPPLVLEVRVRGKRDFRTLYVMAVHNRSLGGIDDAGSNGERVRAKRLAQAQSIAGEIQRLQTAQDDAGIVVIGDFNAFEFTDGYVDAVGQVRGDIDPADNLLSGDDLVEPDLMNQVLSLPPEERYSFVFNGSAQVLDHALTNEVLDMRVRGLQFARGNADAAEDLLSDGSDRVARVGS
ncbi:MAG: lamin tail domain-containing protein [Woeseiaceae bacterium]|nr:lamin tail domain-containing protein [Woeseiaceae bacterium]